MPLMFHSYASPISSYSGVIFIICPPLAVAIAKECAVSNLYTIGFGQCVLFSGKLAPIGLDTDLVSLALDIIA